MITDRIEQALLRLPHSQRRRILNVSYSEIIFGLLNPELTGIPVECYRKLLKIGKKPSRNVENHVLR